MRYARALSIIAVLTVGSALPVRANVSFDFIGNTSLIVVPVIINGQGPYRFLFDTGANNTVLFTAVADSLKIPERRRALLITAGGNLDVSVRVLRTLNVGGARLEDIEIAVIDFDLMKTLKVDGVLGSDYLRRFRLVIDYDNKVIKIDPA